MPTINWVLRFVLTLCVLALPGAWYIRVSHGWEARHVSPTAGDESHYLIIADAIARDHSLQVKAAYDRDAVSRAIAGPIDWQNHTQSGLRGTFSVHGIGVPLLVAPAFESFGVKGVRLMLGVIAGALPFLFFFAARVIGLRWYESVGLAFSVSFGLPFLAASGQIYPDLVTGVLLFGLASLVLADSERPLALSALLGAGVCLGFLPWLHVKNLLPVVTLGCAFLFLEVRRLARFRRLALLAIPPACSLALLALYNMTAFGGLAGPYDTTSATGATARQAVMIFLGLHLDEAQGLFIQQPLLLLGLPGFALFLNRYRLVAVALIVTYLALLLPNSFHPCWYGCWSMSGRFMWSAAALWFLPLVFLYGELGPGGRRAVGAMAGAAVVWQVSLMRQWQTAGPLSLYTSSLADPAVRNSLFDGGWRRVLPSFYDFDRYLSRPTNLVAVGVVVVLLLFGIIAAVRRRVGLTPGGASVVARSRRGRASGGRPVDAALTWSLMLAAGVGAAALGAYARPPAAIDLVQILPAAEKRPVHAGAETFAVSDKRIGSETMRAIYAPPPGRLAWPVAVPEYAALVTAIGIDEEAWEQDGDGVLFRIGVSDAQGYTELLTQQVDPRHTTADRRWIRIRIDLTRYGGQQIKLIFNTNTSAPGKGDDARHDLAYWGAPVVRPY